MPVSITTRLIGNDKTVVLGFTSASNAGMEIGDILKKNLTVTGVSTAHDYTDAVINMLVHNAVNINFFEKKVLTEYNPAELLSGGTDLKKGIMTILKMIF